MKKRIGRRAAAGVLFLALLAAFLIRTANILPPPRTDYGAGWPMYLQEPRNSIDILFLGSSLVYCDVIPAVIYEETGLTAYVLAGPEQTPAITLNYLKEALRTQHPSLVCLEVTGMLFDRYMGYSRANIAYMPYCSLNRLEATLRGAEPESRAGLLFPLYDYHDLWTGLPMLFQPRPDEMRDPLAGYTRMDTAAPQDGLRVREAVPGEDVFQENVRYLQKMQEVCRRAGAELVLYEAPVCESIPPEWLERIETAAGEAVTDYSKALTELELDLQTDFYDYLHLNHTGALKFTKRLAADLTAGRSLRSSTHDAALWQERTAYLKELDTDHPDGD